MAASAGPVPPSPGIAPLGRPTGQAQDHALALGGHLARRGGGGVEGGPQFRDHRALEVLQAHVQRRALHVPARDQVEGQERLAVGPRGGSITGALPDARSAWLAAPAAAPVAAAPSTAAIAAAATAIAAAMALATIAAVVAAPVAAIEGAGSAASGTRAPRARSRSLPDIEDGDQRHHGDDDCDCHGTFA